MKTTFKSMMVIGMMILGTMTTFGKTNANVHNNNSRFGACTMEVRKECHLRHTHDSHGCDRGFMTSPMMDKKMMDHMAKGNHHFDHHGVCKKCKLTRTEVRRIEDSMMRNRPHSMPRPLPRRR